MKDIASRLIEDMRWRLSPAGKRYRPNRKDSERWGAMTIPWAVPLLGGCSMQIVMLGLGVASFDADLFALGALLIAVMFAIGPLAFIISGRAQQRSDMKAYSDKVRSDERFALVEYGRLLERQIAAARADPALGGASEVARLSDAHAKIVELIRAGAVVGNRAAQTRLGSEAELAESIVEAYSVGQRDELAALDARLPEELRSRLDDIGTEAAAPREAERQ